MREELLRSTKLFVDETTAPVLDPGRGRTKTGGTVKLADFEIEFGNNLASEPGESDIKLPLGRALVS